MTTIRSNLSLLRLARVICLLAVVAWSRLVAATPDDVAKVLAGVAPAPGSPLESLTANATYKTASEKFSRDWRKFEERHLSAARSWANRELPLVWQQAPVLYYMFSGPDIVYGNTFFPDCSTYVLCGLEPVGAVPDLPALGPDKLGKALGRLYASLGNVMSLSFFKTSEMDSDFRNPELPGITPVLMTFLARLGKNVRSVDLVGVDREGNENPRAASDAAGHDITPGVKIVFDSGAGTPEQAVYYFSTDISSEGLEKNPGFANFCRKLEPGAGLVKAASYHLHTNPFSATRDFLMERCKFILQDDTGIPATVFAESKWQMRPYGRYVRPIDMFSGYYQKKLAEIHSASTGAPLDFGVGYYYRIADCNMLLASRDEDSVVVAAAAPAAAPGVEEASASAPLQAPEPAGTVALTGATPPPSSLPETSSVVAVVEAVPPPPAAAPAADDLSPPAPGPVSAVLVAEAAPSPAPTPGAAAVLASNDNAPDTKSPRKKLAELEEEELRIRKDETLTKSERMKKLREIWKQQLAVMGKRAA